jgi:glycolate oxidase iron-sulfur subunit
MSMQPVGGPADALRREEAGLLACVHCGFCLNACPTYTRLGHEGDSPRGRLDLMRAVAEGRLDAADPAFGLHIDQCLGCRACEPVCPSGVPYGFLLERARASLAAATGIAPSTRLLIAAYTGPLRPLVTLASRALRGSGVARFLARALPARLGSARFGLAMLAASAPWNGLRASGGGGKPSAAAQPAPPGARAAGAGGVAGDIAADPERGFAEPHALMGAYPEATADPPAGELPAADPPAAEPPAVEPAAAEPVAAEPAAVEPAAAEPAAGEPAARPRRPDRPLRVALLTGCVQASLFARVNAATRRVLVANGCDIVDVAEQRCCGALDAHAGRLARAAALARANIAAFDAASVDVVVVNAAGCGAIMKEYAEQLKDDPAWSERAHAFVARVRDLSELLLETGIRPGAPLPVRVTFDAPCHLHHAQRIREAPLRMLDAVPGLVRVPLADADECCGGAGLYGVHHPDLGGSILADKVAAIEATGAEVVATPNPGCMMQIGAGLLLQGAAVRAVHPVELLDESYRRLEERT